MYGLTVKGLTKSFDSTLVIENLSFEASAGEFCVLLGPSGCGKSTILRLIAGLERADEGEIYIGGRRVDELTPRERDVAMVFQSYALYPHLSVQQNLAFPLKMRKAPKAEIDGKVREAAELLGIEELLARKPRELSGGQRQRVAMGRAIVRSPKLFLFDEPLSNLDAKLRMAMRVELAALHRKLGITTVYVTHDQVEAMTLGDKIILLDAGRIRQAGPPGELYSRPKDLFVATFMGSPRINLIEGRLVSDGDRVSFTSRVLTVEVPFPSGLENHIGKDIILGIRHEALSPGKGPLKGTVDVVENIGSEAIVFFSAGEYRRLSARAPADFVGTAGDEITLGVDAGGLHFFHKGERI